jgi:hypothetical protein
MRYFFQDLIGLSEVPDQVAIRLDYGELISSLGAGHGVDFKKFLKDEDVVKKEQKEAQARNAATAGMEAKAVSEGQAAGQPQQ